MPSKRTKAPDHHRIALAHALGYPDYPNSLTAEPYLNYIANRHVGRGTLQEYLGLFIRVVDHFSPSHIGTRTICALFDILAQSDDEELFADTKAGSIMRREDVEDTIMYILGTWSLLLSSFVQLPNGYRKIVAAYRIRAQADDKVADAYNESLARLIKGSSLHPAPMNSQLSCATEPEDEIMRTAMKLVALLNNANGPPRIPMTMTRRPSDTSLSRSQIPKATYNHLSAHSIDIMDSLESLSIKATRLNAFTLDILGAVQISWTHNVSRHMLLSRQGGQFILELFALPCAFNASSLTSQGGLSSELAQEIQESYCILFNAWPEEPMHVTVGRYFGIRNFCWCWSCSAYRYRDRVVSKYRKSFHTSSRRAKRSRNGEHRSEYDPLLIELMDNESSDWTQDLFPCLWMRITALEEHLQMAKPWSIWILFRDRRDTLQFWTFFFATIVVVLTLFQVALGVAQVVGSFN